MSIQIHLVCPNEVHVTHNLCGRATSKLQFLNLVIAYAVARGVCPQAVGEEEGVDAGEREEGGDCLWGGEVGGVEGEEVEEWDTQCQEVRVGEREASSSSRPPSNTCTKRKEHSWWVLIRNTTPITIRSIKIAKE